MRVGKLKRKLRNPKFVFKLLNKYMEQEKYWLNFRTFKCDSFFVGQESAIINKGYYDMYAHKVTKKIRFLKKLWLENK